MNWPWKHFAPREVLSARGLILFNQNGVLPVRASAMGMLESFRAHLDKPIYINFGGNEKRGWRHPLDNKEIYGTDKFSFHLAGVAFDITVPSMSPEEIGEAAKKFGWNGVGVYPNNNFVHVDCRDGNKAYWRK